MEKNMSNGIVTLTDQQYAALSHLIGTNALMTASSSLHKIYGLTNLPENYVSELREMLNDTSLARFEEAFNAVQANEGYEIDYKFEEGEWVVRTGRYNGKGRGNHIIGTVFQIKAVLRGAIKDSANRTHQNYNIVRATPEQVMEHRYGGEWRKIDRTLGEFRQGDVMIVDGVRVIVDIPEGAKSMYLNGRVEGFYPAGPYVELGVIDNESDS